MDMGEHALLKLLLSEAPVEAFDAPVDEARDRGAPAEEVERLRESGAARPAVALDPAAAATA
jgi:hypothetical protein